MKNFTRFHENLSNRYYVSKKQVLFLMTLCLSTIVFSQSVGDTFFENSTTYEITSLSPNEVKTIGYVISGGPIVDIPSSVTNGGNTYTVTNIGTQSFASKNLTSVTIPNSITIVEDLAFTNNALTSITIPNSVSSIGYAAFGVNTITSVIIPDSVTSLGDSAFDSNALTSVTISNNLSSLGLATFANNNLSSITIPSSITSIGNNVFSNNPLTCVISQGTTPATISTGSTNDSFGNRSNINLTIPAGTATAYDTESWTGFNSVAEGLTGLFTIDNISYSILPDNTARTEGYNTAGGPDVIIPATVTRGCVTYDVKTVGFFSQKNLTSVTIPTSVTVILPGAFSNNPNLASAPLHNGITSIGGYAFNNCALTSVNVPTSMTAIEIGTFGSNNITNVTIPDNITSIGNSAFQLNDIATIVLSNNLTSIGDFAFENNNLTSISFPSTLTSIGQSAFMNNDLTSVTIPNGVTDIPQNAFLQNNLSIVTLPNSVTSIGAAAFRTNQLTTITIPASVTNIADRAFNNNPLTDVYSEATVPPTITTTGDFMDTFASNRSNIHLHIPAGTMGAYVTDPGALWTGFNPVTEDALSLDEFELANTVKVITSNDALEIISDNSLQLQDYTVYSISGMEIVRGKESNIPINAFAKGVYILRINFNIGTVTKKVIIN